MVHPEDKQQIENMHFVLSCTVFGGSVPPAIPAVFDRPVPGGPSTPSGIPRDADTAIPNQVYGTDGNQFAFPDPGDRITIFADPLNRHVEMARVEVSWC